ncbi:CDP-alcohol phosphatidyltransferase family protein [Patiriisocius hiemis]|uniref:CDP-alcohol phosphatidyltransferase family protein n=1 Tax=Patiriisocius hiemis TaxID=3075604 RepID=A0ABU2YDX6_9FLAO|nr:CDP-alcohol phosphatidyltransferase family protein [Constantimarinum sp. W242]MDT0556061.1 CDP-alcohol phosphatidyltransferase family protein [Constantimarinum sp. W242]
MIKQIPNIITSLNLLCGTIALFFAISGDLITASIFVFLGIFFDFFDGLAARLLKAQSKVGLELDSLADMVTSGVVPGIVMVQLLYLSITGDSVDINQLFSTENWNASKYQYLPFFGLLITLASAYRLAKFNVDTRQTTSFIGLPTPANALLILSIPLMLEFQYTQSLASVVLNTWLLLGVTVVSCFLLNAEIPLFSLKFKTWGFNKNLKRYFFLFISLVLIFVFKFIAIPIILLFYFILSLFWKAD